MKKHPFKEYVNRLLNQTWLLITGGVGFIITLLVDVFSPNADVTLVYILILVCSLITGGYFTFVGLLKDYEALENKLQDIESKKPEISVGVQNNRRKLVKELNITLGKLPPEPDFDKLLEEKKKELAAEHPSHKRSFNSFASSVFSRPNPNYDEEVEEYLKKYQIYLYQLYECALDRAFAIRPIILNNGQYPANNVTIEFIMPHDFVIPSEHHCFDRGTTNFEDIESCLDSPVEPQPYANLTDVYIPALNNFSNSLLSPYTERASVRGPKYEERDGRVYVIYSVEKLVQHNPEDSFEPFWLWLANIKKDALWEVPIRITCSELRQPENDILYLDIKFADGETESDRG